MKYALVHIFKLTHFNQFHKHIEIPFIRDKMKDNEEIYALIKSGQLDTDS